MKTHVQTYPISIWMVIHSSPSGNFLNNENTPFWPFASVYSSQDCPLLDRQFDLPEAAAITSWARRPMVKDLHRMCWAQKNLSLRHDVPFWEQSHDVLYAAHSLDVSSHMIDLDVLGASYELGKQAIRCGDVFARNLGAECPVSRKNDHGGAHVRSGYRGMIDLEKLATSEDDDDDVEIFSC